MGDSAISPRPRSVVRVGDYVLGTEIGRGSFATVYKGYNKLTNATVAIKSVSRSQLTKKLLENLESEIALLKRANHPNVVSLLDCLKSRNHIHLVVEYCAVGDLSVYIKRRKELPALKGEAGGLKEPIVRHFLNQLALALNFLQASDIIHRDIKPQNLLLAPPSDEYTLGSSESLGVYPNLKVADFGFARSLPSQDLAETLCGSPLYMAPEILGFQKYGSKADLWSTGAVLYEMITGRPPFRASNHIELLKKIEITNDHIRFPGDSAAGARGKPTLVALDLQSLVRSLLKRRPEDRISFDNFFRHPAIQLPATRPSYPPIYPLLRPTPPVSSPARSHTRDKDMSKCTPGAGFADSPSSTAPGSLPPAQLPTSLDRQTTRPMYGGLARELLEALPPEAAPPIALGAGTAAPRFSAQAPRPPLESTTAPQPPTIADAASARPPPVSTRALAVAEKEYVMVDKRTIEVNILADELASSPKSGHARLPSTAAADCNLGFPASAPSEGLRRPTGANDYPIRESSRLAASPNPQPFEKVDTLLSPTEVHGRHYYPPKPRDTSMGPNQPELEADEAEVIERIKELSSKAQAVMQLADQKLGYIEDLLQLPPSQRQVQPTATTRDHAQLAPSPTALDPADGRALGLDLDAVDTRIQATVEEAFALYHRSLSLLELGLDAAEVHWHRLVRAAPSTNGSPMLYPGKGPGSLSHSSVPVATMAFNSAVQLARSQFNVCEERAEYVKSKSPTDELALAGVSVEQMLHDSALQIARHALCLYRQQEFLLCERGYQWAINLLEALLEPVVWVDSTGPPESDEPASTHDRPPSPLRPLLAGRRNLTRPRLTLRLDMDDQQRARHCATMISQQLDALRRKILGT
ncbi:Serine/threonine-protein kinase [Dimargaris verticillata]|uniref:non-specific serine/threonine protein kinase n=1 Tax=Dimargaris verticillata TaxID=2761393 RepID=A0A9W8B5M0_9FUNG|nr:Serine/threonine-protein kinase [Dimargaris verticillata]